MHVKRQRQGYDIYIDLQQIKQVAHVGYLGVFFAQNNEQEGTIYEIIQKFHANLNII